MTEKFERGVSRYTLVLAKHPTYSSKLTQPFPSHYFVPDFVPNCSLPKDRSRKLTGSKNIPEASVRSRAANIPLENRGFQASQDSWSPAKRTKRVVHLRSWPVVATVATIFLLVDVVHNERQSCVFSSQITFSSKDLLTILRMTFLVKVP